MRRTGREESREMWKGNIISYVSFFSTDSILVFSTTQTLQRNFLCVILLVERWSNSTIETDSSGGKAHLISSLTAG